MACLLILILRVFGPWSQIWADSVDTDLTSMRRKSSPDSEDDPRKTFQLQLVRNT